MVKRSRIRASSRHVHPQARRLLVSTPILARQLPADRASGSLCHSRMWRWSWVDLAKSQVDPESPESPESPEPRAQSPEPRAQSPEPRELSEEQSLPSSPLSKKSDGATSMESEMCYARKLCLAAKSQVMDMFQEARQQGRRPKHDVAAGRRNRCLGAAPTSCPHQRRTHQNARRLHLPALGCRLRPDAIAGPASRFRRGANAPGWHRRTDARP